MHGCAGPAIFQIGKDISRHAAGWLEGHTAAHHVLLQARHSEVRGLGPADTRRAVRPQGRKSIYDKAYIDLV